MLKQKELKVLMLFRRLRNLQTPLARLAPLGLFALLVATTAISVSADVIEAVLVKVNGEILTKTDSRATSGASLARTGHPAGR